VGCIPLYQIHWYDHKVPIDETLETLKRCQEAGKIRYIGCSNFSAELAQEASKINRLESLQSVYNILERDAEGDIARCAETLHLGIIAYRVLLRGLISGKYDHATRFEENDTRFRDTLFHDRMETIQNLIRGLREISRRHNRTLSQLAIRWVLENQHVTSVLTGIKYADQVEENAQALDFRLAGEEMASIEALATNS